MASMIERVAATEAEAAQIVREATERARAAVAEAERDAQEAAAKARDDNKYAKESEIEKNIGKYECNYDNTIVRIYPTSPYGKEDYTLKSTLDCEKEME